MFQTWKRWGLRPRERERERERETQGCVWQRVYVSLVLLGDEAGWGIRVGNIHFYFSQRPRRRMTFIG